MTKFNRLMLALLFLLPFSLTAQGPVGAWRFNVPDNEGNMIPVQVNITDSGTYAVDFGIDGTVEINGKYTVEKDQMTIQDNEGSECTAKGVYKFSVDGNTLTMTRVSDGCENRGGPDGVMKMERG